MKKILVVDDEPQIVRVVQGYLERAGFQVIRAANGEEALSLFRRERPDFVILDLNLPGMDGLDVARAIRRESNVPILMLTARVEEVDRITGLELGADDYVTKPFSRVRLSLVCGPFSAAPPRLQPKPSDCGWENLRLISCNIRLPWMANRLT